MKKSSVAWVVLGCTACVFCTMHSKKEKVSVQSFSLSGEVTGFKDSTWFYIQNNSGTAVDSAIAVGGKFRFNRQLSDDGYPEMAIFETRNFDQAVVMWLENKPMTIVVENGKFQNAKITGSATQSEWIELNHATIPIYRKRDSISRIANDSLTGIDRKRELLILQKKFTDAVRDSQVNFIKTRPDSFISPYLLDLASGSWGKKLTSELFNLLTPEMKNSRHGVNVSEFILLNRDLNLGDKFADFEQRDVDSVGQKPSKFAGKFILLEFWAGWCGPCRKENPELKRIYEAFHMKGFEIFAVSLDFKKNQWTKAIKDDQLPWTHVSELKGFKNTAAVIYGVDAIPDNFLIDQNGIIVARNLHGEDLRKKLERLLN